MYGVGDSIYANHPILPCIFGTWHFVRYGGPGEYRMYRTLTLHKDGSGEIDGESCNWKIGDHESRPKGSLYISIYGNDVCVYGAWFDRYDYGAVYLLAATADGMPVQTTYVNTSYECDHPVHQICSLVPGTYENRTDEGPVGQFTLFDDGTCKVDGVDGIWAATAYKYYSNEEPYSIGIDFLYGESGGGRTCRVFADGKLEVYYSNAWQEIWVEYTRVAD